MARGFPDYVVAAGGMTPEKYFTYSQVQVPIILFDDFEAATIKWSAMNSTLSLDSTGTGGDEYTTVYNGANALKIVAETQNVTGWAYRIAPISGVVANIGCAYYLRLDHFNLYNSGVAKIIPFKIQIYTGDTFYFIEICFDKATNKWYWSTDDWVTSTEIGELALEAYIYYYVKLVLDLSTKYAVYLMINGTKLDLSSVELGSSASALAPCVVFWAGFNMTSIDSATYIDDVKITYNEPG